MIVTKAGVQVSPSCFDKPLTLYRYKTLSIGHSIGHAL